MKPQGKAVQSRRRDRKEAALPDAAPPVWLRGAAYLLIVFIALFALSPLFQAQFVSMDDPGTISQNPLLNPPTFHTLRYYWTTPARGLYAPVTYTFWAGLAAVARAPGVNGDRLDPTLFHAANVLVHLATSLIVACIVRLLLRSDWPAVVAGLIFAVHPLQVEAVAWASGTKDLLAGMFGLLAVLIYLQHVRMRLNDPSAAAGTARRILYGAAIACFVLALLSKPSAITIPAVALLLDWIGFHRPLRAGLRALWPWFILSAATALLAWYAQPAIRAVTAPLWMRPFLVGDSVTFYLWKLLSPMGLAVCYGRTVAELSSHGWFYCLWLVPAAIGLLLGWKCRRYPALLLAATVFVIAPAPMLGLFKFDYQYFSTVADHYVYVAMLGPALAAGWLLHHWSSKLAWSVAAAIIVILAITTNLQSRVWQNDLTLYSHSVDVAPRGLLALHNLANYWDSKGQYDQAAALYRRVLDIQPNHFESTGALAGTLAKMGRREESTDWFRKFLNQEAALPPALRPSAYPDHLFTFAETRLRQRDYHEAEKYFQMTLELRPGDAIAARDLEKARRLQAGQK